MRPKTRTKTIKTIVDASQEFFSAITEGELTSLSSRTASIKRITRSLARSRRLKQSSLKSEICSALPGSWLDLILGFHEPHSFTVMHIRFAFLALRCEQPGQRRMSFG